MRWPQERRACGHRMLHRVVHVTRRCDVPGKRDAAKSAWLLRRDIGIRRQLVRRPQRQDHAAGLEEGNAVSVARLAAEAQCFIERSTSRDVFDAEGQEREPCNGCCHAMTPMFVYPEYQNRLSCAGACSGGEKCSVVSFARARLRSSFSQADSNRRPIIQAIGPEPVMRSPHVES